MPMDDLAPTPMLGRSWCPDCEPERDPTREILETRWCGRHALRLGGADDEGVRVRLIGTGGVGDADGAACRQAAETVHRPRERKEEGR